MESKQIENLEYIKRLTDGYLNTLKERTNKADLYSAEIKLINYSELGSVITNMLKLCILALNQEEYKASETVKKSTINVGVVLEVALQLFPMDEFDLLSEIKQVINSSDLESHKK